MNECVSLQIRAFRDWLSCYSRTGVVFEAGAFPGIDGALEIIETRARDLERRAALAPNALDALEAEALLSRRAADKVRQSFADLQAAERETLAPNIVPFKRGAGR